MPCYVGCGVTARTLVESTFVSMKSAKPLRSRVIYDNDNANDEGKRKHSQRKRHCRNMPRMTWQVITIEMHMTLFGQTVR